MMDSQEKERELQESDNLLSEPHANGLADTDGTSSKSSLSVKEKKGCQTIHLYILNYCLMLLFYMSQNIYNIGVIRTIERRFGLTSTQSGLIMSINDISHILVVVFVGYFGKRAHKPRVLSVSLFLVSIAALLMASPYIIFKEEPLPTELDHQGSSAITGIYPGNMTDFERNRYELSHKQNESSKEEYLCGEADADSCNAEDIKRDSTNKAAYGILLAAQFIAGIGGSAITTLGFAYLDENSEKHKSPMYLGIVTSIFAIGPVAGLGLASICLRLPEVLGSDPGGSASDPTWIGCWWLGYVISACLITLSCIPMWFFPKHIIQPKTQEKVEEAEKQTVKEQFKEFPRSMLDLIKNAAYMVNLLMSVLLMYVVSGLYANLPRYVEIHFFRPAYQSSFVAISGAIAGLIGGFLGGYFMKRMKWGPVGAAKIMLFSSFAMFTGMLINMNLACPQLDMAGNWNEQGEVVINTPCNQNCTCSAVREAYKPVCGDDGLTYFSACHAGCDELINGTYTGCRCVPGDPSSDHSYGTASPGLCLKGCDLLLPYTIVFFVSGLLSSVARSPSTVLVFRIIGDEQKTFALGLLSFAQNLFAFIPAPILFGTLIDASCILWQKTCSKSGTGNCLLYDSKAFRLITHGSALLFEVLVIICTFVIFYLVKKRFPDNDNNNEGKDTKQATDVPLDDTKTPI